MFAYKYVYMYKASQTRLRLFTNKAFYALKNEYLTWNFIYSRSVQITNTLII